jgi:hypothetical protein
LNEPLHRLRILHLSDLHERGPRESEPWRRRRVLGDGWMPRSPISATAGKLRLTDAQLGKLATDEQGNALAGFRLVLMRHPFHELADGADLRRRIAPWADLVLRGHLHEAEVETWADPDRSVRQLAAGCLYEGDRGDRYPNACQVLSVGLDDAGRPVRIDLRFRSFSVRSGNWFDDNSLYKDSQDGRLTWRFPRAVRPPLNGNPYNPWTEATPPRFVGREDLLRRLEAALEEGRCVSLVGGLEDRQVIPPPHLFRETDRAGQGGPSADRRGTRGRFSSGVGGKDHGLLQGRRGSG